MGNKRLRNQERKKIDHRTKKRRSSSRKSVACEVEEFDLEVVTPHEDVVETPLSSSQQKQTKTTSEKKIESAANLYPDDSSDDEDFAYIFMNTNILLSTFRELISYCPNCRSIVTIEFDVKKKMGFAHHFIITCSNSCGWDKSFCTSKLAARKGRTYDINLRAIMAFREIGKGYTDMETFSGYMNIPPPMSNYNSLVKDSILPVYLETVGENMKNASDELQDKFLTERDSVVCVDDHDINFEGDVDENSNSNEDIDDDNDDDDSNNDSNDEDSELNDGICDVTASFDGTWQRRGYASLNGVVSCISIDTGKCLAYECLTKKCKSCDVWEKRKGTDEYEKFKKTHDCPINHIGSAAAMETVGVKKIYERSVETLNLRYMMYIGDGDSKAYPSIQLAQPYGPNKIPEKGECIGHVQKRVGTQLRNLKKSFGKKKLKDGKTIGGRNRLTKNTINRLQNYYGYAIRQNIGSLLSMRKAVGAVLYHCSEASSAESRHQFCDKDSNWCKYRIAQREQKDYVDKKGLPKTIREEIMPIFQDLSKPELLSRCLHGHTQNNNEGLNQLIWKRLPKSIYVGADLLKMGVSSAVLNWNSGCAPMLCIFRKLGLSAGTYTKKFCATKDKSRVENLQRKMSDAGKLYRKKKRGERKGFEDKEVEDEGDMYGCGEF